MNDIKSDWQQTLHQDPDELCQQEVCTGVDGTIIYITTHMFFEDLAAVQDSLPAEVILDELDPVEENMHDSASSAGSGRGDEGFDLPLVDGLGATLDTRESNRETERAEKSGGTGRGSDPILKQQDKIHEIRISGIASTEGDEASPSYFDKRQNELTDLRETGRRSLGRLSIMPRHPSEPGKRIKEGRYFLKKGFCIITHKVPSSEKLNRINIYLRRCLQSGYLFAQFEDYVTALLFTVPLPL